MNNTYRIKILQKCGFSEYIAKKIDSILLERSYIRELKKKITKCKKEYELNRFTCDLNMKVSFNFHYTHLISQFCHACKRYCFRKPHSAKTYANFERIDSFVSGGAFTKCSYIENLIYFTCLDCFYYLNSVCYYCKITYLDTQIKNNCQCTENTFSTGICCSCYHNLAGKKSHEFFERVRYFEQK